MPEIKIVSLPEFADDGTSGRKRKMLMNGPRFHTWINVYEPGDIDEMHCHNADQTFYQVTGSCTMRFPDGGQQVMQPGDIALIPGGAFYQLYNATTEPMILLGSRALNSEQSLKIDYDSREPIGPRLGLKADPPRGTTILV